ncbi:MAG: hypothetical protein MJ160_02205 [Treponema sp.]|nr:hypothetical protein [Treponema sp.]
MAKTKVRRVVLVSVISVVFLFILSHFLIPLFRPVPEVKSVKIEFHPSGVGPCSLVIYDNDDKDFSEHIVYELTKARTIIIDRMYKSQDCLEGRYYILIETEDTILEYIVRETGQIFDCQKMKHIKYDATADIYLFLAMQKLDEEVSKVDRSEEYIRFWAEHPYGFLKK